MYDNISRHVVLKFADPRFQLPRSKYHPGMIVLVLYTIILAARNIGGGKGAEACPSQLFSQQTFYLNLQIENWNLKELLPPPFWGHIKGNIKTEVACSDSAPYDLKKTF